MYAPVDGSAGFVGGITLPSPSSVGSTNTGIGIVTSSPSQSPAAGVTVISVGQVIAGSTLSSNVTVAVPLAELPALSVAVTVTTIGSSPVSYTHLTLPTIYSV